MKSIYFTAILSLMLIGCGGDDENASAPIADTQNAKKAPPGPSVEDRIDDAIDAGNYDAAVKIAIKSGKTRADNMDYLKYASDGLTSLMANGDKKAHAAYRKLNAHYERVHRR